MSIQYFIQPCANGCYLGIQGRNKQSVLYSSNRLYNCGAIHHDVEFLQDNFGYIKTTYKSLKRGLKALAVFALQRKNRNYRVIRGNKRISLIPQLAEEKAARQFKSFPRTHFLNAR